MGQAEVVKEKKLSRGRFLQRCNPSLSFTTCYFGHKVEMGRNTTCFQGGFFAAEGMYCTCTVHLPFTPLFLYPPRN